MSSTEAHVLRKRMLLMRAAQERQDLAGDVEQLREAVQLPNLIKSLVPAIAVAKGLPLVLSLLRKSPLIGSAIGFILRRFKRKPEVAKSAGVSGKIAKLFGMIAMAWQGFRAVRGLKLLTSPKRRRR